MELPWVQQLLTATRPPPLSQVPLVGEPPCQPLISWSGGDKPPNPHLGRKAASSHHPPNPKAGEIGWGGAHRGRGTKVELSWKLLVGGFNQLEEVWKKHGHGSIIPKNRGENVQQKHSNSYCNMFKPVEVEVVTQKSSINEKVGTSISASNALS